MVGPEWALYRPDGGLKALSNCSRVGALEGQVGQPGSDGEAAFPAGGKITACWRPGVSRCLGSSCSRAIVVIAHLLRPPVQQQ